MTEDRETWTNLKSLLWVGPNYSKKVHKVRHPCTKDKNAQLLTGKGTVNRARRRIACCHRLTCLTSHTVRDEQ